MLRHKRIITRAQECRFPVSIARLAVRLYRIPQAVPGAQSRQLSCRTEPWGRPWMLLGYHDR